MERLRHLKRILAAFLLMTLALGAVAVQARSAAILSDRDLFHSVYGRQGMVASQQVDATRIGVDILKRGGNAVDAAVAVGFALAVSLPRAGNLGGGGFMLIHLADGGETVAIDYREKAPLDAHREMFLDERGEVDEDRARFSHLSAGVPGTVAGLALALERHGTMSLAEVVAPAIELARDGIVVSHHLADNLQERRERLARSSASAKIFLPADGSPPEVGERLLQRDLAWSLEQIARHGSEAFYEGAIARKIVADMKRHGGLIRERDLAEYRPSLRTPVRGTYRGYEVVSMPPPSAGGTHLIQMLNILEDFPLRFLGHNSAATIHLMAETMKLAYADRSRHLGDADFAPVPLAGLLSKTYAAQLRKTIDPYRARPSSEILHGDPLPYESPETTHFSVMDKDGNAVVNTYTLNLSYGSGIVAEGTGILLNNEMDDFSAKPGVPNAYGLTGGEANAIEPGKRPLSSMTPTIVLREGRPWLLTGSPGGSRIITTVLQMLINIIDHRMSLAMATAAPRVHHQWLPDELRVEEGISPDTMRLLTAMGHRVVVRDAMGSTQSILRTEQDFQGASDSRRPDAEAMGY